jgi:predicted phosphodiesterase
MWHAADQDADWSVKYRAEQGKGKWVTSIPACHSVKVRTIEPHRVYRATLVDLKPGKTFEYQVWHAGKLVAQSTGLARKKPDQKQHFVVMGDIAAGTPGQRAIAYQVQQNKPDFVFVTGDIVYSRGRISEYREKFFPVYTAAQPSLETGGNLLANTLWIAAPGNHDTATFDVEKYPDAQAYYQYWRLPRNGPALSFPGANVPRLTGPQSDIDAIVAATNGNFPRQSMYSFDYGNAHWTVLDMNQFVDWTDQALRDWVLRDLQSAANAQWRFVALHQPGFNSSKAHFNEQQMRLLADVFEQGKADVVWAGHVHNYQRSFPMKFVVQKQPDGKFMALNRNVAGNWQLDKSFDGLKQTRPNGVIYIVTGAGGAGLYNPEQENQADSWQPFTDKFIARVHSFTSVEIDGKHMLIRQMSQDGKVLDRFEVTK